MTSRWTISILTVCLGLTIGTPAVAQTQGDEPAKTAEQKEKEAKAKAEKERLEAERKRIQQLLAEKLQIEVVLPRETVRLSEINTTRYSAKLRITNPTEYPTVLVPHLTLKVLGPDGEVLRPNTRDPRWILKTKAKPKKKKDEDVIEVEPEGKKASRLEQIPFIEIPAGKTRSFPLSLREYAYDAEARMGWKLKEAGTYTLQFTYKYSRAAILKLNDIEDYEHLNDELRPWNRAPEMTRKFDVTLEVVD